MSTPNPSLYIHNLNDKVNKEEICLQLYCLLSTYGSIIDLVASKGRKMKGQAFVVFADLSSATAAMRGCEGMTFYDKPLRIEYAKKKSYATLKREDPEFIPPSVLKAQAHPPTALLTKARTNGWNAEGSKRAREDDVDDGRAKKRTNGAADDEDEEMEIEDEEEKDGDDSAPVPPSRPPSNTLTCTNLPQEVTDDVLAVLFQQYQGFQSTSVTPSLTPPSKMARVFFDSAELATIAKEALDGFTLKKGWSMGVAFA